MKNIMTISLLLCLCSSLEAMHRVAMKKALERRSYHMTECKKPRQVLQHEHSSRLDPFTCVGMGSSSKGFSHFLITTLLVYALFAQPVQALHMPTGWREPEPDEKPSLWERVLVGIKKFFNAKQKRTERCLNLEDLCGNYDYWCAHYARK